MNFNDLINGYNGSVQINFKMKNKWQRNIDYMHANGETSQILAETVHFTLIEKCMNFFSAICYGLSNWVTWACEDLDDNLSHWKLQYFSQT